MLIWLLNVLYDVTILIILLKRYKRLENTWHKYTYYKRHKKQTLRFVTFVFFLWTNIFATSCTLVLRWLFSKECLRFILTTYFSWLTCYMWCVDFENPVVCIYTNHDKMVTINFMVKWKSYKKELSYISSTREWNKFCSFYKWYDI